MIYTNIEILAGPPDDDYETIPAEDAVTQTDDEYGGWVIDLSKLPKDATHIYIHRS